MSTVDLNTLQARKDRELRAELSADRGVQRALELVEERTSGYGFGGRRRLLAGALRLTRGMSPEIADAVAESRERLGVKRPVEVYVSPEPEFNAFCMRNPAGPLVIGLTARLIDQFTAAETRFVIGHELGHAAYDHFGMPMPLVAQVQDFGGRLVSRAILLKLFLWCRSAELSADRAGLVCAADVEASTSSFFKMASGISSPKIKADLPALATQGESLAATPIAFRDPRDEEHHIDCFATHPFNPFRVRALLAFARSQTFNRYLGKSGEGYLAEEDVERIVEKDLALMEPTYLEEKSAASELMRRLLYSAGFSVAAASGAVEEAEVAALKALLGTEQTKGAATDPAKVRGDLEKDIDAANKEVPLLSRAQLVQHLTIIASADGTVDDAEREEMHRIAGRLGVDPTVVEQTLAGSASPLD